MRLALCIPSTRAHLLDELFSLPTFMLLFSTMLRTDFDAVSKGMRVETLLDRQETANNVRHLVTNMSLPLSHSRSFASGRNPSSICSVNDRDSSNPELIHHIFCNVDDLSYNTQKFALSCTLSLARADDNASWNLRDAIVDAVETAKGRKDRCWTRLLNILDGDVLSQVRSSKELEEVIANASTACSIVIEQPYDECSSICNRPRHHSCCSKISSRRG